MTTGYNQKKGRKQTKKNIQESEKKKQIKEHLIYTVEFIGMLYVNISFFIDKKILSGSSLFLSQ